MRAGFGNKGPGFSRRAISSRLRACLWACVLLIAGLHLLSASLHAQTKPVGTELSFPLQYLDKGPLPAPLEVGKQEVNFRKEPDFGQDRVWRRALKIGPNQNDFMGLAVDFTKHRLYLDLNLNLDLTDDPQGICQGNGSTSVVSFRAVAIALQKDGIARSCLLDPVLFDWNGYTYLVVASSYQGDIELHGKKWQLDVSDNFDGQIDHQDRFFLTPIVEKAQADKSDGTIQRLTSPTVVYANWSQATRASTATIQTDKSLANYRPMPAPSRLFLDGRQYQLNFTFAAAPHDAPLTAHFKEISAPLGSISLDGRYLQRLVLDGDPGLVLLDSPASPVQLPAGKYHVLAAYLQYAPGKPALAATAANMPEFSVDAGRTTDLKVGGPLTGTVTATASGHMLQMNYVLEGMGGETYAAIRPDRSKPPKYAIYQGDRLLGAGNFSYG